MREFVIFCCLLLATQYAKAAMSQNETDTAEQGMFRDLTEDIVRDF